MCATFCGCCTGKFGFFLICKFALYNTRNYQSIHFLYTFVHILMLLILMQLLKLLVIPETMKRILEYAAVQLVCPIVHLWLRPWLFKYSGTSTSSIFVWKVFISICAKLISASRTAMQKKKLLIFINVCNFKNNRYLQCFDPLNCCSAWWTTIVLQYMRRPQRTQRSGSSPMKAKWYDAPYVCCGSSRSRHR